MRKANLRRVEDSPVVKRGAPVTSTLSAPTVSNSAPVKGLPVNVVKNDQHDRLIEEFRKVHRKMFKNGALSSSEELDMDESHDGHPESKFNDGLVQFQYC